MKKLYFVTILLASVFSLQAFAQAPVINSFSPASGPVGTTVTISGSNFNATAAADIVWFGATRAQVLIASSSSTQLTTDSFVNGVALTSKTTYYWKVITRDTNGDTSDSGLFQFTTN